MGILKALRQRLNRNNRQRENPSIADYAGNEKKLITAMGGGAGGTRRSAASLAGSESIFGDDRSVSSYGSSELENQTVEWTLPLVDTAVTEPQTMDEEIKRLNALNDYFVLDSEGEVEFDRITAMASEIFNVPIALVSLVDLGRQWFLSKVGLDVSETPRKHAFCAHVILNKYKLLVVPDATKDIRFMENPLVTGGIKIRFYAGAALVSPEGYKLGTLCIISPQARPEGLSQSQQAMLHSMAGMAISAMVARRNRILKEDYEDRFLDLAKILMDTNKSLQSSQAAIQTVLKKSNSQMDSEDEVELAAVARALGLQSKICTATARNVLQESSTGSEQATKEPKRMVADKPGMQQGFEVDKFDLMEDYDTIANPTTDMVKVFENINLLIPTFPFHGQVSVELDKSVPKEIVADDLLLFRSVFNMLIHCMGQSSASLKPELNKTGLRIRRMKRQGNEVLVQCLQPGPPVDAAEAKALFGNKESLLSPVASMVRSLEGRFGMFEGKWDHQNGSTVVSTTVQSIFWFQLPYEIPGFAMEDPNSNKINANLQKIHMATPATMAKNRGGADSDNQKKGTLDPFQEALLEGGCGGRGRQR